MMKEVLDISILNVPFKYTKVYAVINCNFNLKNEKLYKKCITF